MTSRIPGCLMLLVAGGVLYMEGPRALRVFSTSTAFNRPDSKSSTPARLAASGLPASTLIECRTTPFQPTPHLAYADAVARADLADILCGATPIWYPANVPLLMHSLMLWGPHARFTTEMVGHPVSGEEILRALLSEKACKAMTPPIDGTYLLDSPYGISPILLGTEDATENQGEAHFGQLLKKLGDAAIASSTSVETSSGRRGTVADIYRDAVMRFSLARELEFIACAMVYWLPDGTRTWTNEFNQSFSFDDILKELMARDYGVGSCGGCHVAYVVALTVQRDNFAPILTPSVRIEAIKWLASLSKHLQRRELSSGGWNRSWSTIPPKRIWGDETMDLISVTGHHLEWMAICPTEVLPPKETIARAVVALRDEIRPLTLVAQRSFKTMLPISHAGRALSLLSGVDPFTAFSEAWQSGTLRVIRAE